MTISSSLNAGVSGLSVNATRLAAISDNIANSSTYGYKRTVTDFHSLVLGQSPGSYTAGGVRATSTVNALERGTLSSTQNPTDLAISGRGMLPIMSGEAFENGMVGGFRLTTTGSFSPDANGFLRAATGEALLGWPADENGAMPSYPRDSPAGLEPIRVPTGISGGEPTTEISIGLNLPAADTAAGAAGAPRVLSIEYYGNLGESNQLDLSFSPRPAGPGGPSNTWDVEIRDGAAGGTVIGRFAVEFSDTPANGGTIESIAPVAGFGTYSAATGRFNVATASGPLSLEIGRRHEVGGLSQLADSFTPYSVSKDGQPVGKLVGVEVDTKGMLKALFDTGLTRTLYQIPVADVPNPKGLRPVENRYFVISPDSGPMSLWNAGDGPVGSTLAFTREESTTDVAGELTDLIQTQRAYNSSAKVIQTVDEMLQETTNIKR